MRVFWKRDDWDPVQWIGIVIVAVVLCGLAFAVFWLPEISAQKQAKTDCFIRLKHISMATLEYRGDNNDSEPPFFTFDGPASTSQFVQVLKGYVKDSSSFLCPSTEPNAAVSGMSFVHCESVMDLIPNHSKGSRLLRADIDVDYSKGFVPFLRDRVTTSGSMRDFEAGLMLSGKFSGPHGDTINMAFIDGHVHSFPEPTGSHEL